MNYGAPWWLPDGNLQTIWAALRSRRFMGAPPVFRRERWNTPDGDFVDVDWLNHAPTLPAARGSLPPEGAATPAAWQSQFRGPDLHGREPVHAPTLPAAPAARRSRFCGPGLNSPDVRASVCPEMASTQPLLVVFHGLEGSSASHYAEAFADVAGRRGWACAVPHFRGCSGELNLAPRAYHSGDFAEIDWILKRFASQHAGPVVAVGVSLGGNALMRWAGEMGAQAGQVVAAVASVCAPLDLVASGQAIGRGFNRQVYTRMFLKTMVPKALQKLAQHPGLFNRDALLAARDLYAFDNIFTGPVHGFKGVDDYWSRASAKPHLDRIGVPALALNALNDPFIPAASLPRFADVSAQLTLWQPAQGGHVGFPASGFPSHVRAMPEAVVAFLAAQLPAMAAARIGRHAKAAQNSAMDDIVKQAIAKWPNVPDCYGWLGLDARGNWYMRDDRVQAAGPFEPADTGGGPAASKGSLLQHDKLIDFIQRNYESDASGRWFFQNGPQRVYVELEATPFIWRVSPAPGFEVAAHTGQPARAQRCMLDEQGRLYLETDLGFGLVHTQDMTHAADAVEQGLWVPQALQAADLPARFGYVRSPQALQKP